MSNLLNKHENLKQEQGHNYGKKKEKFGSFMGKLLLKGGKGLIKKPALPAIREKPLRQQSLTEEPFIRLFRARKSRESLFVSDSKLHPTEYHNGIKFSLKSDHSPLPEYQNNNEIKSDSQIDTSKYRLENGRITRWDVIGSNQVDKSLPKTVTAESENSSTREVPMPEVYPEKHSNPKDIDTQSITSISSDEDTQSVESLQSDDDVLGPWIELGMIDRTSMRTESSSNIRDTNICDKCVTQDGSKLEDRTPFDVIEPCSDCAEQWNTIFQTLSSQVLTYTNREKTDVSEQLNEQQTQENNDLHTVHNEKKKATSVSKRNSQAKSNQEPVMMPPTKSAYSIKTNIKMMTTFDKQKKESKKPTDAHYTTGAFMTRRTAKVLADPKFGFYPNPYGLTHKQKVEVLNINGNWYSGTLEVMEKGKVKVKYDDWDDQEEWIVMGSKRLRQLSNEMESEPIAPTEQVKIKASEPEEESQKIKSNSQKSSQNSSSRPKHDDYVSQILDNDKTQIFNNNEIFMTRRLAREMTDEYGFKPNSFGYRRNRAVSVTFFSKKKGERKRKEECIGYLREMHNDQIRVWYPDIHLSEWIPVGSRRLRLLSKQEEEATLSENKIDFDVQEVPVADSTKNQKITTDKTHLNLGKNTHEAIDAIGHHQKSKSNKDLPSAKEKVVSKRNKEITQDTSGSKKRTQTTTEQTKSKSIAASTSGIELRKTTHETQFLTTGAFATRRAMRQLKDDNGFVPNPYGYAFNQAVEVLNTRSGKAMFWERGTLIEMKTGKVKVHYDGWANTYDEWIMVGSRRIRIALSDTASQDTPKDNDAASTLSSYHPASISVANNETAKSDFLITESNPEIRDEVKKNKKRQILAKS
ncbi:hypothetical protein A0J61_08075 [Choanephora cucurbitarum]|uniref:Agenet-like domain-containing protein n=1 Tax=Choanephora cucurbitarum TaxID=101091 RepID=A0A1C7N4C8_9FUNG|nr:hypothetical protein A0J61_08075 [Choanephora cucurbitarum]